MHHETNYEWLASDQAIQIWKSMHSTSNPSELSASALSQSPNRKQLIALLQEQYDLSILAKQKFPNPELWFWTRPLLEQSSDAWCADETALDFPTDACVIDVCAGAGADTFALAQHCHTVRATDLSPVSVALLKANAKLHDRTIEIQCVDAEMTTLKPNEFLNIDPDRRATGKRVTALDGLQPNWLVVKRLIEESQGASMKVAPATDWSELDAKPDTIRYLSRDRSVRQQRWLWNLNRWPAESIVVSVHHRENWVHEVFIRSEADDYMAVESIAMQPGAFVADYDPAIRAARVSARFAERLGCQLLDRAGGYLTAEQCEPHGMVRWFRVKDILSMDSKKLRAYARTAGIGIWELKSRSISVDLDKVRKELPIDLNSNQMGTLLFCRISGRPRVIAAEPIGGWGIPLSN